MASTQNVRVFVSSTCYDLRDLRAELRAFLEDNQFSVALSEDSTSPFLVDPTADSIATCLGNVSNSDVVVCILDRRYGTPLTTPTVTDLSATHAEIRHATQLKKPLFFFIRDVAWQDYQQLAQNTNFQSKWVEPKNPDGKGRWTKLVDELSKLKPTHSLPNWFDLFRSSVDLKPLVLKRLLDYFPGHKGAIAMSPERLVRITFSHSRSDLLGNVVGYFRNVGIGPALDIRHGVRIDKTAVLVRTCGALAEGESLLPAGRTESEYRIAPEKAPVLFCEYKNRFQDRYRVEVVLAWGEAGYIVSGEEQFYPDADPIV